MSCWVIVEECQNVVFLGLCHLVDQSRRVWGFFLQSLASIFYCAAAAFREPFTSEGFKEARLAFSPPMGGDGFSVSPFPLPRGIFSVAESGRFENVYLISASFEESLEKIK